jgi:hypothetical protein
MSPNSRAAVTAGRAAPPRILLLRELRLDGRLVHLTPA